MRSRRFITLYAACLIGSFGVFVPFVHLVPYAIGHGTAPATAVLLLGAIGVGSTVGRFFLGGLADRVGRQPAIIAMFVGMGLALSLWVFVTSFQSLAVFALVYGAFYGGWVAVLPAVVMDYFGGRCLGAILGLVSTSVAIGTLLGPSAAGYAFDIYQSYTLPIIVSACANIFAAAIMATAARVPYTIGRQ